MKQPTNPVYGPPPIPEDATNFVVLSKEVKIEIECSEEICGYKIPCNNPRLWSYMPCKFLYTDPMDIGKTTTPTLYCHIFGVLGRRGEDGFIHRHPDCIKNTIAREKND